MHGRFLKVTGIDESKNINAYLVKKSCFCGLKLNKINCGTHVVKIVRND